MWPLMMVSIILLVGTLVVALTYHLPLTRPPLDWPLTFLVLTFVLLAAGLVVLTKR
jgi:hypothetical protein